ncbi:hypothetical protein ACEWY4_000469 [Coilia grayii]|uniref:Uncharacterized protein n=1 Tax=Coilia grayii TaxID=363190 RepID=A0ABD1KWQ2_9TELE
MRLCDLFRCCLPVPEKASDGDMASSRMEVDSTRKKKRSERANLSGKKLRKEAKRLKKEMVDRRRKEVEMAVSEVQEGPMEALPLAEGKERAGERVECLKNGQIIIHQALVHAGQHANQMAVVMSLAYANGNSLTKEAQPVSCPTQEEERRERLLGWFDRREAAKKKAGAVCSVTRPEAAHPNWSYGKQFSMNDLEEERRLQLLAWFQRRGLTTLKPAVTQAPESCNFLHNRRTQLAELGRKSPSQLDRKRPVTRPRLDSKKYQLRVHQGEQRRRLTPQEKDALEEERRLQLLAWFQRRGLTALKAADTQAAESCTSNGSHDGDNILPQETVHSLPPELQHMEPRLRGSSPPCLTPPSPPLPETQHQQRNLGASSVEPAPGEPDMKCTVFWVIRSTTNCYERKKTCRDVQGAQGSAQTSYWDGDSGEEQLWRHSVHYRPLIRAFQTAPDSHKSACCVYCVL